MRCRYCKSTEELHKDGTVIKKQLYCCRKCNTKRCKKYRGTMAGILASRKAVKLYESTHKRKKSSWTKAQSIKLKPCELCGVFPAHRHHPDTSKPLEVVFLCPLHHKSAHLGVI